MHFRENIIQTCKNHSTLIHDLTNFSANTSALINMLHINIVNYEIIVKSFIDQQQYVQNQDDDNEHLFVNRRFRRDVSSFNRRDNNITFRENFNFNDYRFRVQLNSKKCFVCEKMIADSLIIRNSSAINSKSVSRIVFLDSRHVQNLIVV